MPRQLVWTTAEEDIVCTVTHQVMRSPSSYEVRLSAKGAVVAVRTFANRADALSEAERLRRQFLDADFAS